jgi:hypothetical protein
LSVFDKCRKYLTALYPWVKLLGMRCKNREQEALREANRRLFDEPRTDPTRAARWAVLAAVVVGVVLYGWLLG